MSATFQLIKPTLSEQQEWDFLVEKHGATVFSQSIYLNALEGSWYILYNEKRTGGMVCPFIVKLGQKILMNPTYHQYSEWVGEGSLDNMVIDFLKTQFKISLLCHKSENQLLGLEKVEWKYQLITNNNFSINTLAKRMLKKSENYLISFNSDVSFVFSRIETDLVGRVQGMNSSNVHVLKQLASNFENRGLISIIAENQKEKVGGIWLLENTNSILYLKGSVEEKAKKDGVMYRLIHEGILLAMDKGKTFDFGGSNVENVRRFNHNLGGTDLKYQQLNWNFAPWWWNLIRKTKHLFKS